MTVIDLHLHSRFARATSRTLNLKVLAEMADRKGIDLLATSDWTHPLWRNELRNELVEDLPGNYRMKEGGYKVHFVLGTEISCIYKQGGRVRRVHLLLFVPNLGAADAVCKLLEERGANLNSDGRPIIGLSAHDLLALALEADPACYMLPAHIWTPWFAMFGSKSGFDSVEECFGDLAPQITAVETGLSADPSMHWDVPDLASRTIVSFSDAHSAPKLGREATVLEGPDRAPSYAELVDCFSGRGPFNVAYTIEYFPEEGKYFWTGHRDCQVSHSPAQDLELGTICPVCYRHLTVGVAHRTLELAQGHLPKLRLAPTDALGRVFVGDAAQVRRPYVSAVPLLEVLQVTLKSAAKAGRLYDELVTPENTELWYLLYGSGASVSQKAGPQVAEAIMRMRRREISLIPGYDGEFGKVSLAV